MESEAIELDGRQSEYPLSRALPIPQLRHFSVTSVDGLRRSGSQPVKMTHYTQFESFHHQDPVNKGDDEQYYRLRTLPSPDDGGFRHRISFVRSNEPALVGCDETISVSLLCTNRDVAGYLRTGSVTRCTEPLPDIAAVSNIMKPTQTLRPLLDHSCTGRG